MTLGATEVPLDHRPTFGVREAGAETERRREVLRREARQATRGEGRHAERSDRGRVLELVDP